MAREAKYIVIRERGIGGHAEENLYPFSSHIIHKTMATKIGGELGPARVRGAGFIKFTKDGPRCYGKSVSLRVNSRPEDTELANEIFGDS